MKKLLERLKRYLARDREEVLSLGMSPEVMRRIDGLANRSGCRDKAELVTRALAVYELLWSNREGGGRAVLEFSDGQEVGIEIIPPGEGK